MSLKYNFAWSKNTAATVGDSDSDINKSLTFKIALQVHADYKDNLSQTV